MNLNDSTRRQFLRRAALWGGIAVVSPAVLAACDGGTGSGGTSTGSDTPRAGGTLTLARTADALSLDPTAVSDNESIWVCSNMYERLYESDPAGRGSNPSLATSYTESADHLTWTFRLRNGVHFSDGTPLTAADVKYSIDRCTASDANGYMNAAFKHVSAPTDDTVVITANYPADIPGLVSYYGNGVVPANLGGKSPKQFFQHPTGTGAFVVTEWAPGNQMTLRRNEHYWRPGQPYLDTVKLTVVANDQTRLLQLRGGQADVIEAPPWSQIGALKSTPNTVVDLFPSTRVNYLAPNFRVPQLGDVHVRRAISLAIDRHDLVKAATFGRATPAGSIFSPTWPDYDPTLTASSRDLAAAERELAQSNYRGGFSLDLVVESGASEQSTGAQVIQQNLADLGIRISIQEVEPTALETQIEKGNFQLNYSYVTLDLMDPFENVPYLLDPAAEGVAAYGHSGDPLLTSLSTKAAQTADPVRAQLYYRQIQQRVAAAATLIPLYYSPYAWARQPHVRRFVVPPTGDYRLAEVFLAR